MDQYNPTHPSSAGFIEHDDERVTIYQGCKFVFPYNACVTPEEFPGLYATRNELPDEVQGPIFGKVVELFREPSGKVSRAEVKLWRDVEHDDDDFEPWLGIDLDDQDQLSALVSSVYMGDWDEVQVNSSKTWTCELCGKDVHSDHVSLERHEEMGCGAHLHADCAAWISERLEPYRPTDASREFKNLVCEWRNANPTLGCYTAAHGVPFTVVMVFPGSRYGRAMSQVNSGEMTVEFYDARYMHTRHGQFVSRYGLSILLGQNPWSSRGYGDGLLLDAGVESWRIDGACMNSIISDLLFWLSTNASKGARFEHVTDEDLAEVIRLVEDRIDQSEDDEQRRRLTEVASRIPAHRQHHISRPGHG